MTQKKYRDHILYVRLDDENNKWVKKWVDRTGQPKAEVINHLIYCESKGLKFELEPYETYVDKLHAEQQERRAK